MLIRHSGLDPFHMPPVLSSIHQLNQQPRPFFYGGGGPVRIDTPFQYRICLGLRIIHAD